MVDMNIVILNSINQNNAFIYKEYGLRPLHHGGTAAT